MTINPAAESRGKTSRRAPDWLWRLSGTLALLVVAWFLGHALLILFCGLLVGIFLEALSAPAVRLGIPRIISLLAVIFALSALIVVFFYFFGTSVASQFRSLTSALDETATGLQSQFNSWGLTEMLQESDKSLSDVLPSIRSMLGKTAAAAWGAFGIVGNTVIVLMIGTFIAAEPSAYRRSLLAVIPAQHRNKSAHILDELGVTLRRWLLARFFNMTVIFLMTWAGLALIGVPQALVLSLLSGMLTFIPTLGPIIAAIPIVISAFSVSSNAALWAVALYLAIQSVESYILTPVVQKRAIELYPAFILALQFIMATTYGLLGLAVATPLGAMALVVWREAVAPKLNQESSGAA